MEKRKQKIDSIPLILVLLVPLIVYGMLIPTGLSEYPWYSNSEKVLDVFVLQTEGCFICFRFNFKFHHDKVCEERDSR